MRCKLCGKKAVVNLPHHRLSLCADCYPQWFLRQLRRAINSQRMFGREDRILVAVSGGKDSLTLWHALVQLGYEADGFHIHLGIEKENYSERSLHACQKMARSLRRKLVVVNLRSEIGSTIPQLARKGQRNICSVCGIVKRYFMNRVTVEGNYACLATGHNLDDECATLLSNVLRWDLGYLAHQSPVLPARNGLAKKVRPLFRFTEKETLVYALLAGFEFVEVECPYSRGATSIFLKSILNQIEHESPGTKIRFYTEFLKVSHLFRVEEPALSPCEVCGQPTTVGICAFCRLLGRSPAEAQK